MLYFNTGQAKWIESTEEVQRKYIVFLQNELEMTDRKRRMDALSSFLYLVQGIQHSQFSFLFSTTIVAQW